jgi:hypothetical protein
MTCDHIRTVPGCPSCEAAVAALLASPPPAAPAQRGGRPVRTLTEARAAFPKVDQIPVDTAALLADLKARYLLMQPKPSPEVHEYAARNRASFSSPEALAAATPDDLWAFITSPMMAAPGHLGTFYKGWNENGPEATAASLRGTIEYLLRGPGDEEDRLTDMVGNTYGVGVVLLTKVLCVMQPQRFIALLPYESGNGKGKQDIGRVAFGLPMPNYDSTGLSVGRLAYWSNDLLREALEALPGTSFVDLEHAKEFLWHAFSYLQEWPSVFDNLPTDPAAKAISDGARDLTAGQGHSVDPQAVEKIGMDMVTAYFSPPWKVELVDREKCGWDITATLTDARLCIEVKATSGPAPTVYVTANELDKAETNPDWVMAVVTNALAEEPLLRWHTAAEVVAAVKPVVYRARLNAAVGTDHPRGSVGALA